MPEAIPLPIPADAIDYIRAVFASANARVTSQLDRNPNVHEEALDLAFIEDIAEFAGPRVTPSGVVVDIDLHFVGGGWHWRRWEVADIGVVLNFRLGARTIRTKVVLLQSKRLYPREVEFVDDRPLARPGGFGSLITSSLPAIVPRTFHFDSSCRYRALHKEDEQWQAIAQYEEEYQIPVHYLLYHPSDLPHSRQVPSPATARLRRARPVVAARVVPSVEMRSALGDKSAGYSPLVSDLGGRSTPGVLVQDFIADEVLPCRAGYVATEEHDQGLNRVFNLRSGPIAAAIRFDVLLPDALSADVDATLGA